jgi:26S proteasome regulatory subunit N8
MPGQEVQISKVVVHPLVLLSVVDHFNRMGKIGNQKRVVGVLLGCWRGKGVLDVSNSFAGKISINLGMFNNFTP